MSETNILSWTPQNWLTVLLMVAVAYVVIGAVTKAWKQRSGAAQQ